MFVAETSKLHIILRTSEKALFTHKHYIWAKNGVHLFIKLNYNFFF